MPSSAETYILLGVLVLVLASLPVAMMLWRRRPADGSAPPGSPFPPMPMPMPAAAAQSVPSAVPPPLPSWYNPYAPPGAPAFLPPPADLPGQKRVFGRPDAWFAFGLVLMVSILMGPLTSLLVMLAGKEPESIQIEYTPALLLFQLAFQGGIIIMVLAWLGAVRKFNLLQILGFKERGVLTTILVAVLCLVVALVLLFLISPLIEKLAGSGLKRQSLVDSMSEIKDPLRLSLIGITICAGAPLMEELIFRGMIYGVALRYFHPVYANVASSLLFGVVHGNLLGLVPLTLLGVILAESYRLSRTLAVPILVHAGFNGLNFILLMYGPEALRKM